jgi:PBP1b-binding outer membrane lipoprotein LpoB
MNKIIYAVSVVVLLLAGCAASGPTISVNSAWHAHTSEHHVDEFGE